MSLNNESDSETAVKRNKRVSWLGTPLLPSTNNLDGDEWVIKMLTAPFADLQLLLWGRRNKNFNPCENATKKQSHELKYETQIGSARFHWVHEDNQNIRQ